jgi:hypothetical protein
MHPASGKERYLEKFIFAEMQTMMKAKGMQGGLLMRYQGQPAAYLTVTFWDSRGDWYSCMQETKLRERVRPYLLKNPRTRWYLPLARVQGSEFKRKRD